MGTIFGVTAPLRIWEGKNRPKFRRDFAQLHISIANISGTDEDIDKRKRALSPALAPTCDEKNWVNFGPQTKKL